MKNPHTVNSTTDTESRETLAEAVKAQQTPSLAQRRAFMKLPLEERRRILVEQADAIAVHYCKENAISGAQSNWLSIHSVISASTVSG